jgi:hypothetical protein
MHHDEERFLKDILNRVGRMEHLLETFINHLRPVQGLENGSRDAHPF